jgi:adenylosuccinate lyase
MGGRATIIDSCIFGSLWAHSGIRDLFEEEQRTQAWLEIIAVLAEVQAEFQLVPQAAASAIARRCRDLPVDAALLDEIRAGREACGHSMQGLIEALQRRLAADAAQWVYAGATVQDITDTWLMCVLRDARQMLAQELRTARHAVAALAEKHRDTPMAGRTHGQQGLPITFGFKAAVWLAELARHEQRLAEIASRMDIVQLCGGVGSASSLGPSALAVQRRFAEGLGLRAPDVSWTCSRDTIAEWCQVLALIATTADRIGHEIYSLQRTEIGELRERFVAGTVGSITMPHKRNPEIAEHLGTLSRLVRHLGGAVTESMVHDHERDGRSWKTEWHAVPEVTMLAGRAVQLLAQMLEGLEVDEARMRSNLAAGGGAVISEAVMLALASHIGRDGAHRLVYEIARSARDGAVPLAAALRADSRVSAALEVMDLAPLLDAARHTGSCAAMVDQVLGRWQ